MSFATIISGGTLVTPDGLRPGSLALRNGQIAAILPPGERAEAAEVIDATGLHVLPGLIDIHCHIRAPAYPQRGTVESETAAAVAGGITTVFEMPITNPCCNSPEQVALRRDHFAARSHIDFGLYAAPLTLTEEAVDALAATGIVAFKIFTTPAPADRDAEFAGLAWPNEVDQFQALRLIARTGLPVVVHAESAQILARAEVAALMLDPADARTHGAARPAMAEALAVAKLLTMNIAAQAKLHIAHVTSAATLDVLRRFHGSSDFSAETCPHYLRYTEKDVARVGVAAKINPPIRQTSDREALWQGIADGTIAHVTTDHAGFSPEEKAAHEGNFLSAPPGHPGTEILLPAMLDAVAEGKVTVSQASTLLSGNGAARFGLPDKGRLVEGRVADIIMVDLAGETRVTETGLRTAAAANARLSHGERFRGRLCGTFLAGRPIWRDGALKGRTGDGRFVTPKGPT
ncbi:MAG: dihydroorotase [Inquilinaceae bacterium]